MKRNRLLLLLVVTVILNVGFAAGQALNEAFDAISNIGLVGSFQHYPKIWDGIFLIWIFIVLGREVLSKTLNSKPAGGAIGAVLGLMAFGGLQFMNYSLVKDFGPWAITFAMVALIIFIFRMFQDGEKKKNIGAVGVLAITTFLTQHGPTKDLILGFNSLIFGIVTLIWILSLIFTLIWAFGKITTSIGGGDPGALNKAANFINRNRDGAHNLRESLRRNRPRSAPDTKTLQTDLSSLKRIVGEFGNLVNKFVEYHNQYQTQETEQTEVRNQKISEYIAELSGQMSEIIHLYNAITSYSAVMPFNYNQKRDYYNELNNAMGRYQESQAKLIRSLNIK